jgi:hypothetical protein
MAKDLGCCIEPPSTRDASKHVLGMPFAAFVLSKKTKFGVSRQFIKNFLDSFITRMQEEQEEKLARLGEDVISIVLSFLDVKSAGRLSQCNKFWNATVSKALLWRQKCAQVILSLTLHSLSSRSLAIVNFPHMIHFMTDCCALMIFLW